METKVCARCGRELPVEEFNKHAKSKDGLQPYCKECQSVANKEYNAIRPRTKRNPLAKYTDADLINELKNRAKTFLLNPTPRDMMQALAALGYKGKLEITQTHVIDINNF